MILSSKNYARALIEALEETKNSKKIAKDFWALLQQRKQYKNLHQIIDQLDQEYARKKKFVLVKVASDHSLDSSAMHEIKSTLEKRIAGDLVLTNVVEPNVVGIIIRMEDKIFDLSLTGKIQRLKKEISK
jgi:F0F1-type ATP synthase delta subunit